MSKWLPVTCYEDGSLLALFLFKISVEPWITHVSNFFIFVRFCMVNITMIQSDYHSSFIINVIYDQFSSLRLYGVTNENDASTLLVSIDGSYSFIF